MTCACEADVATYLVPHQAGWGVDPETRGRVAVTDPLTPAVCFTCRGVPLPVHPHSPHRGASSVIHRYYWRELAIATFRAFLHWCRDAGLPLTSDESGRSSVLDYRRQFPEDYDRCAQSALAELRERHDRDPIYDVSRPSDAELLATHDVGITPVPACYVQTSDQRKALVAPLGCTDSSQAVAVEAFVADVLRQQGLSVMALESRPLQCLLGALMWLWVQDPDDPNNRPVMFGGRDGDGTDRSDVVWTLLPEDFGAPGHARRRETELDKHLAWLPQDDGLLAATFDYWLEPSRPLRQYLWAYTDDDEQRARTVIRVLGAQQVVRVLRFLAVDYWGRYLGWPDLLTWRETDAGINSMQLIEVKSSGDRLSDDQRRWIAANSESGLHLPFQLVKVHRRERLRTT